jgi:outer membrane lipoprotein-sorting protein
MVVAMWGEPMNELCDDHADRLESALACFDRSDGVARARLLAALAADVPPINQSTRKVRFENMKRYASRTATAAALLLAPAVAWYVYQPRTVQARVVQAMSRAKGFRCDFVEVSPGYAGAENAKLAGRVFWSPGGEERLDLIDDEKPQSSRIYRPGNTGLRLEPKSKQYEIIPKSSAREFSFGIFGSLGEFKGKTEPIPGPKEIRGVKAEGFTVPWSAAIGDDTHSDAKIQVWLDPAKTLPVRVDLVGLDPRGSAVMRLENFQWGAQDAKLFATSIPAGYTKIPTTDVKADEITEYVVYGLSTFAKYNNGKYPAVKYVYGDQQGEALRKLIGMSRDAMGWVKPAKNLKWPNPKEGEFAHGSYGLSWINSIQRDFPEGAYNGKSVTPQDATKVLVRWQLDDGEYRVIFGDLKSDTVSTARLRELESR